LEVALVTIILAIVGSVANPQSADAERWAAKVANANLKNNSTQTGYLGRNGEKNKGAI
jgi:hypothetical protein